MRHTVDLLKEACQTRDLASRAQRLAVAYADPGEKGRLGAYAEELLKRAARLEKTATNQRQAAINSRLIELTFIWGARTPFPRP